MIFTLAKYIGCGNYLFVGCLFIVFVGSGTIELSADNFRACLVEVGEAASGVIPG